MPFQSQVYLQPAPGVAGQFCSENPRATLLTVAGGLVAGAAGVTVGNFAWANGNVVNSSGGVGQICFIGREQQGLITGFMQGASLVIPQGLPVTGYTQGDFWDRFAAGATAGQTVYANFADGTAYAAAAGSPPTSFAGTGSVAITVLNASAVVSNSSTASIAGPVMTITAITAGSVFAAGQTIAGTNVLGSPVIVAQLTGTAGGIGTYQLSTSQTSASATVTSNGSGLTVTSMTSGVLAVDQVLTGGTNAFAAGTTITALGTGNGGAGTYAVSGNQTLASVATASVVGTGVLTVSAVTSGVVAVGESITSTNISGSVVVQGYITGTGGLGTYFVSNTQTAAGATLASVTGVATQWIVAVGCGAGELAKITTWSL